MEHSVVTVVYENAWFSLWATLYIVVCDVTQVYLVDYGLAYRYIGDGGRRTEYKEDPRRTHDGTIEFTSRDAHRGVRKRIFIVSSNQYLKVATMLFKVFGYLFYSDQPCVGFQEKCSVESFVDFGAICIACLLSFPTYFFTYFSLIIYFLTLFV